MRFCNKCYECKDENKFPVDKRRLNGIKNECKSCRNNISVQKRKDNIEAIREKERLRYKNLSSDKKKEIISAAKIYVSKRRDAVNENARRYYKENKKQIREKFNKRRSENIEVYNYKAKVYRNKNKDEFNKKQRMYRGNITENDLDRLDSSSHNNSRYKNLPIDKKEKIRAKVRSYYKNNKESIRKKAKEARKNNPIATLKSRERARNYYFNNKEKCLNKTKELYNNRRNSDPLFKLMTNTKSLIGVKLRQKGYTKKSRTYELIGIDYITLKKYLERLFIKGMTWDNYGYKGWHIDHKIPLASAKNEEELLKLFHYTNLQPLWAKDNIIKRDKILPFQTNLGL